MQITADIMQTHDLQNSALISLQSVFDLSASVDRIAPILKENQQLHDADDV